MNKKFNIGNRVIIENHPALFGNIIGTVVQSALITTRIPVMPDGNKFSTRTLYIEKKFLKLLENLESETQNIDKFLRQQLDNNLRSIFA